MSQLVHLALVQFKPRKGDYAGNLGRLKPVFAQLDALSPRPTVACFAESALTGYFLEGGVRDTAVTAGTIAADLNAAYRESVTSGRPLDVTLGFYEIWNNKLYNSAVYATTKAAVTTITECLWGQLREVGAKVGASLLYPSTRTPGMLNTGIWRPGANRPDRYDRPGAPPQEGRDALGEYQRRMDAAGMPVVFAPLSVADRVMVAEPKALAAGV